MALVNTKREKLARLNKRIKIIIKNAHLSIILEENFSLLFVKVFIIIEINVEITKTKNIKEINSTIYKRNLLGIEFI